MKTRGGGNQARTKRKKKGFTVIPGHVLSRVHGVKIIGGDNPSMQLLNTNVTSETRSGEDFPLCTKFLYTHTHLYDGVEVGLAPVHYKLLLVATGAVSECERLRQGVPSLQQQTVGEVLVWVDVAREPSGEPAHDAKVYVSRGKKGIHIGK